MSDTAPSTETPNAETPKEEQTHPWGDDFDPARAWSTITQQREAEKELREKLASFEKAEQERADAGKTELERAIARAEKAEQAAKAAQRASVLAKSGLPEELHDFVTGETDEAIAAQVEKLTAALAAKDAGKTPGETPDADEVKTTSRPQAALTPGHGGDEAPFDADAIVAAVR